MPVILILAFLRARHRDATTVGLEEQDAVERVPTRTVKSMEVAENSRLAVEKRACELTGRSAYGRRGRGETHAVPEKSIQR